MRSTVRTVGTTAVDLLADDPDIKPGNTVSLLVVPRADVCVVGASDDTYDNTSFGTVGPTGDVATIEVETQAQSLWVVANSADQEVAVFWTVG